jgi:LysM repeat protein
MVCQVQLNSIKFLEKNGATDDIRRIINEDLFNKLNDSLTDKAERIYGLETNGSKLFSVNTSEHIDPYRSTYWRDAKVRVLRAEPNVKLFERLQELFNARNDKPMFMKAPEVDYSLKIVNALNKINRNKFESSKLQGWLNDLQKQGVSAQQLEHFKEVAKPGMTKDEIAAAIAATYSYTIEINTAKTPKVGEKFLDREYGYELEVTEETLQNQINDGFVDNNLNTQYYSNLTVPGGTNYTEQEIATPAITPSIKGHAQFATDKGIGWFRSDEQSIKETGPIKYFVENAFEDIQSELFTNIEEAKKLQKKWSQDYPELKFEIVKSSTYISILSKTRRVLEVQSDLFQKGRDRENLIEDKNMSSNITDSNKEEFEVAKRLGIEEEDEEGNLSYTYKGVNYFQDIFTDNYLKYGLPSSNTKGNQFLQLLNKDNNWINFFTKSIIQDSAKKGYEKVLFPSGNTASKVEGHTTLEEFKKQKEDRIRFLDGEINDPENIERRIEEAKKEKEQVKQELERVEREGFGALKPIYNFYENTVTNILKKQGYSPKKITDEYGNTWNEITIDQTRDTSPIAFMRENVNPALQEINGVLFMDVNLDQLQDQRSKEIAEVLAQRLSLSTNTQFRNVSAEEAANILKNRPVKYNGEPAFYYAGTVYVVGENINVRTVLHEFSHPVLNALRQTNNILFQNLYNQALATEEGQGIYYYVVNNYPELEENSDLFKEEVLAYAMQLKALNRINNDIETEGYQNFMNKLLAAIKQLLRKLFGSKIDVAKLDVDTSLEEMADMLLDKDFEFKTDRINEEDLAMFSREVVERARELNKFSNKESMQKVVKSTFETTRRVLSEAEGFKGDKASRKLLRESLFEKGTNRYIREVLRTLRDNLDSNIEDQAQNQLIQNALDTAREEMDVDLERATALVNSLDTINSMTKNMLLDISKLSGTNINNRSTIALLMLYKSNSKAWLKMVQEIDEALTSEGGFVDTNNPFYKTLNEIVLNITRVNTNIANILKNNNVQFYVEITGYMSKYVQDRLKGNLGIALKQTFPTEQLEREVNDLYDKVVQQKLTEDDIDALVKKGVPENVLTGFLKEYKELVVDEDKIKAALTGGAHDVTWFNRWLESYSSSNDVIVGPLAMFIQNEKTQVQNLVWEQSMKFRNKLEKLLPKVGFSKLNSVAMRERMGFKDKIFYMDKKTGKPVEKEIWSYLGAFKDYRYHYDLLDYNLEEAKKTEDVNKIAQAQMEFDEFKRDYMWQEFVPEFYEKDDIFKQSEVGQLAYYVRKQKLQAFNNLVNSMENELERFEKYSTIQAAFREFQQLYSLTYEDGTPKIDDPARGVYDLSIAKVLQEHRAATKGFYEWRPIEGMLQSAYNEFIDLLATKQIFPGSGEFKRELEKWRRQNLRMEYNQEYWDSRVALTTELRELQAKMNEVANSRFDVAAAFQTINDLIYSYRDEQGEPDSNAMGKTRLERIKDAEQAIADFKFQYDISTGLSKEDSEELKNLQYKARKGLLQAGSPESKRYFYLLELQEKEGINPADAARIQEIFTELSQLTENLPTVYYIETLNYNLSKQNIKEVDEDDVDNFINSDEFQDMLDADEGFKEWFNLNHYTINVYDEKSRSYIPRYKRTKANTVAIPKDSSQIKYTRILNREGNEVLLMGAPNARHSRYEVKDQYRTIPFGAAKEDYVGKFIDNKNQWLPRMYQPGQKYSAKDNRFMNERYFQMQASNSAEFQLLEAIKEYHLQNQKGMSNYSKLYLDMPRYALRKGDIYQSLQKANYGSRFSEIGSNIQEWTKQLIGRSVTDSERTSDKYSISNENNYDPNNNLVNTDLDGNQITYVPVSGIYNLDIENQDADIFQGLFKYALSIQTQGKLLESLPLVNSILDTLEDPDNAPKDLEKFDKNIYSLKGALTFAKKKFSTNNRLGQVKSLIEREYYGKMVEGIEETHPQFGKWINGLQGLSARGSLAINLPSDLKNKYGAYVQLIIEGSGAEFINLKDIALARPWAEKAMLEWTTKGIYQTGPGAISTQLVQIFDPNFKSKDEFGREIERSMLKDLANMEWLYMHRKFGEMQVAMSLFGAFMYGQKVEQVMSDGSKKTLRYIEAWEKDDEGIIRLKPGIHPGWSNLPVYHEYTKGESLESIAKKYYIPLEELKAKNRIKSEVQLEDGQELIISKSELFMGLKNRIQGTSRKLFGTYDEMGQPEGNKLLLYRMFFFMRKWFTPMLMNRFGFDSKTIGWTRGGERYDWATTSYGKGFYITAFQAMLKTMKSGFRNYNYLTDQEKTAVRKLSAEAFFAIGLALIGLMVFGFDPDDDDKWKKLRAKSGAMGQDSFNTYGFMSNHMLLLMMGVQAETSAFVPLPSMKGVNFGADDYVKMLTQTTSAWYNTVVLYIDIFGDALDFVTFSEMDRYKRDTGPYSWKEEGDLKLWSKLGKAIGFTGSTGDPVTSFENQFKSQSKGN